MTVQIGTLRQQVSQGLVPLADEALTPALQAMQPGGLGLFLPLLTVKQGLDGRHVLLGQQLGDAFVMPAQGTDVLDARRFLDGDPGGLAQLQALQFTPGEGDQALSQVLEGVMLPFDLALAGALRKILLLDMGIMVALMIAFRMALAMASPGAGMRSRARYARPIRLPLALAMTHALGSLVAGGVLHSIHSRCSRISWGLNSPRNSLTSRR